MAGYVRHVRTDVQNGTGFRHHIDDSRRFLRRLRRPESLTLPPHDLATYGVFLEQLIENPRCRFVEYPDLFIERDPVTDGIEVVLRHDVDHGDIQGLLRLCDLEEKLGLRAAVHFIVDGSAYDLQDMAETANNLAERGFDVGLHTTAWMEPDPKDALDSELARFGEVFGFEPRTMSQHGVWPRTEADLARRRSFTRSTPDLIKDTSLEGYQHRFAWVSEDSNRQGEPFPLSASFFDLPTHCYGGGLAVVLTHDGHWA